MVLTSPPFAVSLISSHVSQAEISSFVYHKHLIIELHSPNMLTPSNLIMFMPHDEQDHYPDLILANVPSGCILKTGKGSCGFCAECNVFVFVLL